MSRCPLLLPAATLLFSVAPIALPPAALAETGPSGWKTVAVGKNAVMTPLDLAPGEFYQITVYPRQPLGGAAITDFLDAFVGKDMAGRGKVQGEVIPAAATNHTVASAARVFVTPQGALRGAMYNAVSIDGENVRVISIASSVTGDILTRYQAQVTAVIKYVVEKEKTDAQESGRGQMPQEDLPPTPAGMTPGGKVVPGIYAGNAVYQGEIRRRFRLYVYASGEFSMCDANGVEIYVYGAGNYDYDAITGKMDLGHLTAFSLYNSRLGADDAFCLYGRGTDGKPYIHSEENLGFGRQTTILHYIGPPNRPSPKQAEAQKAAAAAEAKRYKFVTAPGKGVPPAQIVGVMHKYVFQAIGPGRMDVYLLLKDGTIHDGLPVPPDELDVAQSRRREPENWGRWRRQGADYLAAWPDHPGKFEQIRGQVVVPARPGERITGRFSTGATSGSTVFGGSWSIWGVTFSPDGRFLKDRQGGSSSGSLGSTLNDFSVDTTYGDDGATTSFSSPGAVGHASSKKPGGHRGGTYSLSGYTLTLRYDDGRVAHLPFFFTSAKRNGIYFEGTNMTLDSSK